ncbi:MAG: LysE family transporter [Bacteroidales bacterium]|nr:LysE family transporter [Bacteroidales bacterium]
MLPFFEGVLLGLTLAVLFGPALFSLLQTSVHRGPRAGVLLALGIIGSDITIVLLCYMGVTQLLVNDRNYLFLGLLSGIIMIIFGIVTYTRKVLDVENGNGLKDKMPGPLTFLLKGYFLNIANPFIWIFWISLMVGISANYDQDKTAILAFFAGALVTILATDFAKVAIANRIKKFLTIAIMTWVNRIVGIILCFFGVVLIARVCFNF